MRVIDADRLKIVLEKNFGHTGGAAVLAQLIDDQPTVDAVEVVRCENCEFWVDEIYKDPTLGYCEICDRCTDNDDFCSTGTKMDGGDE